MNSAILALQNTAFPVACTSLGAAAVFFFRKEPAAVARRVMMGFAAGVMLAASVWSLLLPAIAWPAQTGIPAWLPASVGFILGAVGLMLLEQAADRLLQGGQGHVGRVILGITLHNLPEGMIIGLAAAYAARDGANGLAGLFALSLGIGLQNLPEGAAISLPMRQAGATRLRSFAGGVGSGLVEPLGAVAAALLAGWVDGWMPWMLSFAAGCMVCVTAQEMIPLAAEEGRAGVLCIVLGFALMMALDVALG